VEEKQFLKQIKGTSKTTQKRPSSETRSIGKSGEEGLSSMFQKRSSNSELRSSDSKGHWRKPVTIKELAANINTVANAVLNGEIDLRTAQVYGALVRVVAQTTSLEVTRGRFLKEMPDLSLEEVLEVADED
jgi:hypothetical protein